MFTEEMAFVMGGQQDKRFLEFENLCCRAYNSIRRHGHFLINIFKLMLSAGNSHTPREPSHSSADCPLHLATSPRSARPAAGAQCLRACVPAHHASALRQLWLSAIKRMQSPMACAHSKPRDNRTAPLASINRYS